jgi:hypothetical protein
MKMAQKTATHKPVPPRERVFGGEVFELWSGEYGPESGGHTKAKAQHYAETLRRVGNYARVVEYGRKYFVYFR